MPLAYALIHEEGGVYGISFPDFPGCISTGNTAEEALRKGAEALTFHVEGMSEDFEPLPRLRALSELLADRDYQEAAEGAVAALVSFGLPAKAVRVNVSLDENLLQDIDRAAAAAGQSRSAYLSDAARQRIRGA